MYVVTGGLAITLRTRSITVRAHACGDRSRRVGLNQLRRSQPGWNQPDLMKMEDPCTLDGGPVLTTSVSTSVLARGGLGRRSGSHAMLRLLLSTTHC